MLKIRLITEGEVAGACRSSIGQEAAIVGACMALRDDDYISGTHRLHGYAWPVAPSIIDQDFTATAPNQKWGVDIA